MKIKLDNEQACVDKNNQSKTTNNKIGGGMGNQGKWGCQINVFEVGTNWVHISSDTICPLESLLTINGWMQMINSSVSAVLCLF